jgi:hypothetical protein
MISISNVHNLEAGTSICLEARGNAVFDDGVSLAVRGSQTLLLMHLGGEYARF